MCKVQIYSLCFSEWLFTYSYIYIWILFLVMMKSIRETLWLCRLICWDVQALLKQKKSISRMIHRQCVRDIIWVSLRYLCVHIYEWNHIWLLPYKTVIPVKYQLAACLHCMLILTTYINHFHHMQRCYMISGVTGTLRRIATVYTS